MQSLLPRPFVRHQARRPVYRWMPMVLVLSLLLAACGSPTGTGPDVATAMLALLNDDRASGRLCDGVMAPAAPALSLDARLSSVAQAQANYMRNTDDFEFDIPGEGTLLERLEQAGYLADDFDFFIGREYFSVQEIYEDFITDPDFCDSLLTADFEDFGAARAGNYWAFVVAVEAP